MSVAIISAYFGGYHQRPVDLCPQDDVDDAVLVSEVPLDFHGWRNVIDVPDPVPRMAAKHVKCHPERYVQADTVIWIDAQLRVTSPSFASFCISHLRDRDIALMRHPWRSSLRDEAAAGALDPRFIGQDPLGQAEHYASHGHPDDWGLYWTMIVVRRMTSCVIEFGRQWLQEQKRWSTHDQVSFPYVCRRLVGRPSELTFPTDLAWLEGYPVAEMQRDGSCGSLESTMDDDDDQQRQAHQQPGARRR